MAVPATVSSAASHGTMIKTIAPSSNACIGNAIIKSALENDMPFFNAIAVAIPQIMCVAALAPTIGPSVAVKPIAAADATIVETIGPKRVESITGTCDASVAE